MISLDYLNAKVSDVKGPKLVSRMAPKTHAAGPLRVKDGKG